MPSDKSVPQTTVSPEAIERAAQAIYDARMCDGDGFANLIHVSDYIRADVPIPQQLEQVRDICRQLAQAALEAAPMPDESNVSAGTDPLPAPPRMTEAEAAQIDAEMAIGSLQAIHNLLDDGGIPRGTFADDHVRNLVALYNQRGDEIERLREALVAIWAVEGWGEDLARAQNIAHDALYRDQ